MQARGLFLTGEATLTLDAFGIPFRSRPSITCTLPAVGPSYDPFPATSVWTDGETDIIRLDDHGPVAYSVRGVIVTDGNREFLNASGTLNDGGRLVINYPPASAWGPPDGMGTHSAHTTVTLGVTDGRPCTAVSQDWGRFWR